jgi:hypothetical protein
MAVEGVTNPVARGFSLSVSNKFIDILSDIPYFYDAYLERWLCVGFI